MIKGAKGASFLNPETVTWLDTHAWTILLTSFIFFTVVFQLLAHFTGMNILKPIVLIGTFALAMAFAANDLVNFIGVPLAGISSYKIAAAASDPLNLKMVALQQPIHSNTFLLLIAGAIMVTTLWVSKKARSVTRTEVSLGRQDEGIERFGSSALSRIIVRMIYNMYTIVIRFIPVFIRRTVSGRMDSDSYVPANTPDGQAPSFDLLRASVNLLVASALVSLATSLKLPLSTTYVTFMVAMGSSFSDRAWGRESAVYRVTGVLTVIGGWFFTAFVAFSVSLVFACLIYNFKMAGTVCLLILAGIVIVNSYRLHYKKEQEIASMEAFSLKNVNNAEAAVATSFEQTGLFLKEVSDTLGTCFEAAITEDWQRLKDARSDTDKIQKWADVIVANVFKTLFLLHREDISNTQKYSHTARSLQSIAKSHSGISLRVFEHFDNNHSGFIDSQKEELRQIRIHITRLLWNTSIMLLSRKRVDFSYVANQSRKIAEIANELDRSQIGRIQNGESKTRLSILFYGILEDTINIAEQTRNLLDIFREAFQVKRVG